LSKERPFFSLYLLLVKNSLAMAKSAFRKSLEASNILSFARKKSTRPPEVNGYDHQINLVKGSTSVLELTAQRIQSTKTAPAPSMVTRIEELTRESGYLRKELHFYRQCFMILQKFRESTYEVYQQLFLVYYFDPGPESLHNLTNQLHQAVENSMRDQAHAEGEWMQFWGLSGSRNDEHGPF
jgi:hypothetical protein